MCTLRSASRDHCSAPFFDLPDNNTTTTTATVRPSITVPPRLRPPTTRDRCRSTPARPTRHAITDRPSFFHQLLVHQSSFTFHRAFL